MIGQLIVAFFAAIMNRIASTVKLLGSAKFYFALTLMALLTTAVIFKDSIELAVRGEMFSATDFREARDPYALQTAMNHVVKGNTNILYYGVFLYEPKNQSFYKKLILTNSEVAKASPALQMVYLKDQPTINAALASNGYYLIDQIDLNTHKDLKSLKDLGTVSALYYRLSSNGVPVGEISLAFKERPTPQELDTLLKVLAPYLYDYII